MGICASPCVGSPQSQELLLGVGKERGTGGCALCWGMMSLQHPWERQIPSLVQQDMQGKRKGISSPGKGGFEGSVARNPPSHPINVRGLCEALSAAGKAR